MTLFVRALLRRALRMDCTPLALLQCETELRQLRAVALRTRAMNVIPRITAILRQIQAAPNTTAQKQLEALSEGEMSLHARHAQRLQRKLAALQAVFDAEVQRVTNDAASKTLALQLEQEQLTNALKALQAEKALAVIRAGRALSALYALRRLQGTDVQLLELRQTLAQRSAVTEQQLDAARSTTRLAFAAPRRQYEVYMLASLQSIYSGFKNKVLGKYRFVDVAYSNAAARFMYASDTEPAWVCAVAPDAAFHPRPGSA